MDVLLQKDILEEERNIITWKQNRKQAKMRTLAWNNIKVKLGNNTRKVFEVKKLQKKWNNIQQRVKKETVWWRKRVVANQ